MRLISLIIRLFYFSNMRTITFLMRFSKRVIQKNTVGKPGIINFILH